MLTGSVPKRYTLRFFYVLRENYRNFANTKFKQMITCDDAIIEKMVVHKVGNKVNNEPLKLSPSEFMLHGEIGNLLMKYFTTGFKSPLSYRLSGEVSAENNKIWRCAKTVFDNPMELYSQSLEIAEFLYNVSEHPNIKSGELYIALLSRCFVEGETVDALGIFKSENKETYLKVFPQGEGFDIESDSGININKLDKGCIIYNKEAEEGFVVQVVDVSNRSGEAAAFWTDSFLNIRQRQDAYFNTQHTINLCKGFVSEQLPEEYEINKADQAALLSKTADYLKDCKQFDLERFGDEVFGDDEMKQSFRSYREQYEKDYDMDFADNFTLSDEALRREQRYLRTILKLDKNFTVYIHGARNRVEHGEDPETGLKYYKFLYDQEK